MALILHNPGVQPLGQFDSVDASLTSFKGGEVCYLSAVTAQAGGGTDLAAADVNNDGYVITSAVKSRPAVALATTGSAELPFFLSDDGINSYGTLLGSVVGSTVGQTVTGGAVLGPHTASGSGKITLWGQKGLYGTTTDAVDVSLTPAGAPAGLAVGAPLSYNSTGQLTPVTGGHRVGSAPTVAYFVSFETNGSLVTTPNSLTSALNSPSGNVSNLQANKFTQAVYWFVGA